MNVGYAEILRQIRIAAGDGFIHGIRNVTVREVAGWTAAKLADVQSFGEVHFEECTFAVSKRDHVLRILSSLGGRVRSKGGSRFASARHGCVISTSKTCAVNIVRTIEGVERGVILQNLHAAAMAVHIAEAANVH